MADQVTYNTELYHRKRKAMIVALGGYCFNCKKKLTTKTAQFAHRVPTGLDGRGRGSANRIKDVMLNPSCYGLMCDSCHREHDRNGT